MINGLFRNVLFYCIRITTFEEGREGIVLSLNAYMNARAELHFSSDDSLVYAYRLFIEKTLNAPVDDDEQI